MQHIQVKDIRILFNTLIDAGDAQILMDNSSVIENHSVNLCQGIDESFMSS